MPLAPTPAGDIWYELEGEGPLTVLVSGLAGHAAYWAAQAPLRRHRRLLTYDHIGIGWSARPRGSYSVEGMAADLLGLLDVLGIPQADFVGHSTGGCILQVLAATAPVRMNRAVIVSSWLDGDWRFERLFRLRQAALRSGGLAAYAEWGTLLNYPPDWAAGCAAELRVSEGLAASAMDPDIVAARIDAILQFNGRRYASGIKVPVTIAAARDDQVTPPHMSRALARALKQERIVWFETGGHCVTAVQAAEFNRFLLGKLPA